MELPMAAIEAAVAARKKERRSRSNIGRILRKVTPVALTLYQRATTKQRNGQQSRRIGTSSISSELLGLYGAAELGQAAEKLFSEGVILSEAKDLLSARAESKADPSDAQNRRDLRMTLM
jgi:hypothetical protein